MCGIVGYIGGRDAVPIMIDGLSKLEYRGYDSAGVAVVNNGALDLRKKKGKLEMLLKCLAESPIHGPIGIGHTRWATHGAPADMNAHPHTNTSGSLAIVHNGIIENYAKIREFLSTNGHTFKSQTDTEVIVQLIDHFYNGNLLEAVGHAVRRLTGAYAFLVLSKDNPDELIAVRKDSPLVIGVGENENFVASDVSALIKYTRDVYYLDDNETARITRDGVEIFDAFGMPVEKQTSYVDWNIEAAEKAGYPYFMLKEINEEPKAVSDTIKSRLSENGIINIADLGLDEETVKNINRIVIVACGTAYHAGLVAKYNGEKMLNIPIDVDIASEYRYRCPIINKNDLFIAISQSGETADTKAALALAKEKGARVLSIVNAMGSSIARDSDYTMFTMAGPEIAVASTKAYTTQLICLDMLLLEMGRIRGAITREQYDGLVEQMKALPEQMKTVIEHDKQIKSAAHKYAAIHDIYFLGRNIDYALALEGSLKLKEISYIHSDAYAAGELKHGPIALVEKGTVIFVLATQKALYEKTASNIKEVKARGAYVISICAPDAKLVMDMSDEVIKLPSTDDMFMPIPAIIPAQMFAYYCSIEKGLDVDKPRNLAKSVTVE